MDSLDDYIIIGRNAKENSKIVSNAREESKRFYWFHVADRPSAHLILKLEDATRQQIKQAALRLKIASKKYSSENPLKIEYTRLKYVHVENDHGLVTLKKSKYVNI